MKALRIFLVLLAIGALTCSVVVPSNMAKLIRERFPEANTDYAPLMAE